MTQRDISAKKKYKTTKIRHKMPTIRQLAAEMQNDDNEMEKEDKKKMLKCK